MKNLKFILTVFIGIVLSLQSHSYGQQKKVIVHKGGGGGHGHHGKTVIVKKGGHNKKVVVVRKSKYRPTKTVVYHPAWGPRKNFNRRWVYFPKYHCYWDNWRNVYFYRNGKVWVSSAQKPAVIVNVNLEEEKHYELNEADDENDEIYESEPESEEI